MDSRNRTIYFSLCKLARRSGVPRWKSDMKKIFLPAAICMGKYNSLGIYHENINIFWTMYTHNQGFFNICSPAWTGGHGNKGGNFVFIFFCKKFNTVPDIKHQLV